MWPDTIDVEVLDISPAGALLHTSRPLDVGTRGRLRLNLWGNALAINVEVRRISASEELGRAGGFGVGVAFIAISPPHRQILEEFGSR
jgi:hypothetical protein